MWSYVQYRRLRKDVEREWQKHGTKIRVNDRQDVRSEREESSPSSSETRQPRQERTPSTQPLNAEYNKDEETGQDSNDSSFPSGDQIAVECTSEDDSLDPQNWSLLERSKNIAILVLLIFVQAWAGADNSLANTKASQDFHVGKVTENLSTAMYLFGIGSGCLFVGPLSETVGRNPVYLISTFTYLFFVLGSALTPTFGGQVVCRYLVGLFSSATLGINGASVRDQFRPVKRAVVFPVIAWANVVPPTIAPIVGGWVVSQPNLSWRWCEWITLIISGFGFLVAFLFLPETYKPILLDWKAKHLRQIAGDSRYVSEHAEQTSFWKHLKQVLPMPATFFGTEPIIAVLGGYLVLLYILLFSFLSGFDYIFKKTYNLSNLQEGACFGSIAAGATTFTLFAPWLYSWARRHTAYIQGAPITPEFRLWPAMVTAPLLPISLFWLGWTNYSSVSIWSGLGACFTFGIVLIAMYISSYEYIIDSYGDHAAIALASVTMVRYLIAGGMVIAARPMYTGIGVHWTMTLLGCVASLLTPGPYLLHRYGERLRERSPFAKDDFPRRSELTAGEP